MYILLFLLLICQQPRFEPPKFVEFQSWEKLEKSINAERLEIVIICSQNCPQCYPYKEELKLLVKEGKYQYLDVFYIDAKYVNNQYYKVGDLVPFIMLYVSGIEYNINLPFASDFTKNYILLDDLTATIENVAILKKFK